MQTKIKINGKNINIREVTLDDAEFILSLRCDEKKSRFLHKTEYDLEKQKEYIENYFKKDNEYYLIIENKENKPIGTYRIYDIEKENFTIGSWLMIKGASAQETLEGDYLVRNFAFKKTKLDKIKFDVRKENTKVVRYHKLTGSKIISETALDYIFECKKEDYLKNMEKFGFILEKKQES